jgi:hypothetical protein
LLARVDVEEDPAERGEMGERRERKEEMGQIREQGAGSWCDSLPLVFADS